MFNKILIANRGEIACRIIRTCKRLGIQTVAVYSDADARALHVDMADEAYLIGPSPALESYLKSQTIIDTAITSGAEAIHPGYGFLSENAEFAEAVKQAGLIFIGPSASVIRLMGDKLQAKTMAQKAGVSLVPGSDKPVSTKDEIKKYASQLGYPLLLKAAAGGGGKGMRIVYGDDQIDEYLERTTNEALSSFGDGRIFVEKYIESPRHIEIQILADKHGNIIHLGERDCSLQRRHQKIIEESPSPFITTQLRNEIASQAVILARQVGYTSVGTIEFMVSPNHDYYFLEMNTRLQVEHPVTEMVTGLDLVEQMIRIAAGETLKLNQEQVAFSGHAIEARIYAEDTAQNFLPSSGRITQFEPPLLGDTLRLDTGIEAGSEVSIHYDPMIGKLIAWAPDRVDAILQLQQGLAQFILEGPIHNIGFLEQLLYQPKIMEGDFSTQFIEHELKLGLSEDHANLAIAIAGLMHHRMGDHGLATEWIVAEGEQGTPIRIENDSIFINQKKIELKLDWHPVKRRFTAYVGKKTYYGQVHWQDTFLMIRLFGVDVTFRVMRPKMWELLSHIHPPESLPDNLTVRAPMPGILISLPINVGDKVKAGQPLLVIEAMKMENILKSPANGKVREILVRKGDSLMRDQILIRLE